MDIYIKMTDHKIIDHWMVVDQKMLMEQLEGEPSQNRVAVPTELLVRGSTASPGSREGAVR